MLWSIDIDPRGCLTVLGLCHWQCHPYSLSRSRSTWSSRLKKRKQGKREKDSRGRSGNQKENKKRKEEKEKKERNATDTMGLLATMWLRVCSRLITEHWGLITYWLALAGVNPPPPGGLEPVTIGLLFVPLILPSLVSSDTFPSSGLWSAKGRLLPPPFSPIEIYRDGDQGYRLLVAVALATTITHSFLTSHGASELFPF